MNIGTLILVLAACVYADDNNSDKSDVGRQKRLLFFDEGGSLVHTYSNPYMNRLSENGQNLPFYGNFLNPFFNFIRNFGNSLIAYTIPVSNAIIESIKLNPNIQNTLVMIPKKDPVVAPNPLCEGKRTQIPAPNLCNNFLNCWDGWAFEQECPNGLLFSVNGYCDYADNVDCHNRKLDADKPQPQPLCSKDFEAFRNQYNCNEFFICVNRQPVKFQCPADLAYSQILGVCDYADRVDCSSSGNLIAAIPQPVIPPSPPALADTPSIPEIPMIPPVSSVITPESPVIPPALPVSPPSSPIAPPSSPSSPPLSPVIPPAPATIPQFPSLLPPGSVFPPVAPPSISEIFPSQRPVPPADVFPSPIPEGSKPGQNKPPYPHNIFLNPGCSSPAHVAMSRQDAINLLQQAISSKL